MQGSGLQCKGGDPCTSRVSFRRSFLGSHSPCLPSSEVPQPGLGGVDCSLGCSVAGLHITWLSTGREVRFLQPRGLEGPGLPSARAEKQAGKSQPWKYNNGNRSKQRWSRLAGPEAYTTLEVLFRNIHKITNTYLE